MSRYKVFLLQVLLLLPLIASSEEISLDKARDIAYDFMTSRVQTRSAVIDLRMVYDGGYVATRTETSPAYYVFDNASGPGFVIVSGDDSSLPVLGYSDSFNFKAEGMPSNLRWWLNTMRSQIEDLRRSGAPSRTGKDDVGTEVLRYETALWDQAYPYYNDCPMYGGRRSLTGCGPTAISIAMRYREWPDAGVGTIPAYTTDSYGIRVSKRSLGTAYDWKNMPLTDGGVESWTSAQKAAVARLIADVGAATEADYSPDATGIYDDIVPIALAKYMKYDNSIYAAWRDYYSADEWYPLIRKELENGPVIYSGADDVGGHMFVLDGYTSEDYYHVNWGWGGMANGYYVLAALNPQEQGFGANELGTYNLYQTAMVNMIPDEGGQDLDIIRYYVADGYRGLLNRNLEFEAGIPYSINSGYFLNPGDVTYDGMLRIVVVDAQGEVKQVLYETEVELEVWYYLWLDGIFITIDDIQPGDRMLAQFYNNGTGEWEMVRGNADEGAIESVLLAEEPIDKTTKLEYEHASRTFTLTVGKGVEVECTTSDGEDVPVVRNADGTHSVSVDGLSAGECYIDLSRGKEYKRLVVKL